MKAKDVRGWREYAELAEEKQRSLQTLTLQPIERERER